MLLIRQERIARGWTQEFTAMQVGISNKMIQAIETGQRKPSYDVLVKLSKLFNKCPFYLLAQEKEKAEPFKCEK